MVALRRRDEPRLEDDEGDGDEEPSTKEGGVRLKVIKDFGYCQCSNLYSETSIMILLDMKSPQLIHLLLLLLDHPDNLLPYSTTNIS